jgi:hypothetical protein
MPLADHHPAQHRTDSGPPCGIANLLATLNPTDAEELADWLEDGNLGHTAIATSLTDAGYRMSHQQVSWHRRQKCKCYR